MSERFPNFPDDGRRMIRNEEGGYDFKVPELTKEQRFDLREALAGLGRKLRPLEDDERFEAGDDDEVVAVERGIASKQKEDIDHKKRTFLKQAGAAAAVMTGAVVGIDATRSQAKDQEWKDVISDEFHDVFTGEDTVSETEPTEVESIEGHEASSKFEKEMIRYQLPLLLERDEIWFVDAEGQPVGGKVRLAEISDGQNFYSPGVFNEIGILKTDIDHDWLDRVQAKLQAEHPDRRIVDHLNVAGQFAAAYRQDEEPKLSEAVASGEVKEFKGIIEYHANKPVIGAEHKTRIEYVQQAIRFEDVIPQSVQRELRQLIPGLCAQESKFHNGLTSGSGAKGIFQFMPDTWAARNKELEEKDGKQRDIGSLVDQVEVAGIHFSRAYQELIHWIGDDTVSYFREYFSDDESFQRDFIVPLLVNSYNAGSARVAEGVRYARDIFEEQNLRPEGKDVFVTIADLANEGTGGYLADYGQEAREYVPRIYAQAGVLRGAVTA